MNVIGACSLCGGAVCTPDVWGGIMPPTPSCARCGAIAMDHGPIIPMRRVDGPGRAWTGGPYHGLDEVMYRSSARQFCGANKTAGVTE